MKAKIARIWQVMKQDIVFVMFVAYELAFIVIMIVIGFALLDSPSDDSLVMMVLCLVAFALFMVVPPAFAWGSISPSFNRWKFRLLALYGHDEE